VRLASEEEIAGSVNRSIARFGSSPVRSGRAARPSPARRLASDHALVHGVHRFDRVKSLWDADGWADFLAPHFAAGACNFSGTYCDGYGYSHGLMASRNVLKDFAAFKRELGWGSATDCCGVEHAPQGVSSGRPILHFHGMIAGARSAAELAEAHDLWADRRGWSVVKPVTDREGCVEYAAKHLLKQGAADNFDFHVACEYKSAIEARFDRRGRKQRRSASFSSSESW
jgi:hypothetical protein